MVHYMGRVNAIGQALEMPYFQTKLDGYRQWYYLLLNAGCLEIARVFAVFWGAVTHLEHSCPRPVDDAL
jgi:hypothetical protein